ncbi:MAG: protein kinase domain-containing protein [Phycisphaerales bacterium]
MLFHEWASLPAGEQAVRLESLRGRSPELAELLESLFEADRDARPVSAIDQPTHALARALALGGGSGGDGDEGDGEGVEEGAPISLPGITLHGVIARGGSSDVYEATQYADHDHGFERRVAVKIVSTGRLDASMRLRVAREATILASLSHPSIARLYDCGLTGDGRAYLVQEFCGGSDVCAYAEAYGLSLEERVELMVTIGEGITAAHSRRIIHRDLKPANVLMSDLGAGATPKIIDFGIGKSMSDREEDAQVTRHGILGTPAYLSPEAASGRAQDLDTRTDVYGLGLLLHRLIVGSLPHDRERIGTDIALLLHRMRTDRPESMAPRDFRGERMPSSLRSICRKALALDPDDRYATAEGFVADLRAYLKGAPIAAERPSLVADVRRAWRRHRRVFVVGGGGVLAALALGAMVWMLSDSLGRSRAERSLYEMRYGLSRFGEALAGGRTAEARALVDEMSANRGVAGGDGSWAAMLGVLEGATDCSAGVVHRFDGSPVGAMARTDAGVVYAGLSSGGMYELDPSGGARLIASTESVGELVWCGESGMLMVRGTWGGYFGVVPESGEVIEVKRDAFEAASGHAWACWRASQDAAGSTGLPEVVDGALAPALVSGDRAEVALELGDGAHVIGTRFGQLYCVCGSMGTATGSLSGHERLINSIVEIEGPDGALVLTGSSDGTVRVWDRASLACCGVSQRGAFSVSVGDGRAVAVWVPDEGVYIDGALVMAHEEGMGPTGILDIAGDPEVVVFLSGNRLVGAWCDADGVWRERWRHEVTAWGLPMVGTAVNSSVLVRVSHGKELVWCAVLTGEVVDRHEVDGIVISCALGPGGGHAMVGTTDGRVSLVPIGGSGEVLSCQLPDGLVAARLHAVDDSSAMVMTNEGVFLADLVAGECIPLSSIERVWSLGSLGGAGGLGLVGTRDGLLVVVQLEDPHLSVEVPVFDGIVQSARGFADADGTQRIVVTSGDGRMRTLRVGGISRVRPIRR